MVHEGEVCKAHSRQRAVESPCGGAKRRNQAHGQISGLCLPLNEHNKLGSRKKILSSVFHFTFHKATKIPSLTEQDVVLLLQ